MPAAIAPDHHARPFRSWLASLLPLLVLPRRYAPQLGGATLAAASIAVVLGWNSSAGSPLHEIRVAREQASLVLAHGPSGTALRLSYAEERLRDAGADIDSEGNLAEATTLLDQAKAALPSDHGDPLWTRWAKDERLLLSDQGEGPENASPLRTEPHESADGFHHGGAGESSSGGPDTSGHGSSRGSDAPSAGASGGGSQLSGASTSSSSGGDPGTAVAARARRQPRRPPTTAARAPSPPQPQPTAVAEGDMGRARVVRRRPRPPPGRRAARATDPRRASRQGLPIGCFSYAGGTSPNGGQAAGPAPP
jgi:hypothetical protein